ncbi:MAG: type II toxin-antitoxin system RelE/ParE family toxin [Bacteroidota bacterium]
MKVLQTNEFAKAIKKLPKQQKADVDRAVRAIVANPSIGQMKVGDLAGVQVYKFKLNRREALLAYEHDEPNITLFLLKLGQHENFYRDLKRGNPQDATETED